MSSVRTIDWHERAAMLRPDGHALIGGGRRTASDLFDKRSPIDGRLLGRVARGQAADIDAAVRSARSAFEDGRWSRRPPAARKRVLLAFAEKILAAKEELALLETLDMGKPIQHSLSVDVPSTARTIAWYAEAVDKVYDEIAPTGPNALALIQREPMGVIGAIVPWNYPMIMAAWKIAPALAAGNSVVLKPSEDASLSLLRLAQLCLDAGLPPGVLNVVTGTGAQAGEALARHMDVDILTFTGSGPVGRLLLKASAESNLKRVYLELGGKSPNIVFDDAPDLAQAAKVSAMGIFRNSGQVCVAGSRLLVQRAVHDEFVERVQQVAASLRVGDPLDVTTDIGAVSSARQLARNQSMLARALAQGARLRTGGQVIEPVPGGQYMQPAVLDAVQPDMDIARQEVFGPVLAVMPFDDEAQAVRLANGTEYGLASGVWTGSLSRAHRMVRAIKAGVVHVNTYGGPDITVPLGGVRQSGNGHDKSMHALDKYLDLKTAWIQL